MVKTVVQPKPLSSYLVEVPALPTVEVSVPLLHLPSLDGEPAPTSPHLEVGAAGMLQVRTSNWSAN